MYPKRKGILQCQQVVCVSCIAEYMLKDHHLYMTYTLRHKIFTSFLTVNNQSNLYLCCCSVTQLYFTLCDPVDCSPLDSSAHAISQARIMEWVAISFSMGSSWLRDQTWIFCISWWILHHWATKEDFSLAMHYS